MPVLKVNPTALPKEELIKELTRNNIPLPPPKSRKDVYVKLYRKHFSTDNNNAKEIKKSEFSSDEEETVVKNGDDTEHTSVRIMKTKLFQDKLLQVEVLSREELKLELESRNECVGPLVGSTLKVYQRKLARLLAEDRKAGSRQEEEMEVDYEEDYSDSDLGEDEEMEEEEEEEEEPVRNVQAGGDTGPRQRVMPRKAAPIPSQPQTPPQTRKPTGLVPIWVQMLALVGLSLLIFAIWYNMEEVAGTPKISTD